MEVVWDLVLGIWDLAQGIGDRGLFGIGCLGFGIWRTGLCLGVDAFAIACGWRERRHSAARLIAGRHDSAGDSRERVAKPSGRRGQAHFAPRTAQNEPVPNGFAMRSSNMAFFDNGGVCRIN